MEKLLLKPAEAAEALGVGRSKMYELLSSGLVPSMKVGGSVRVPAEALRRWVENQAKKQKSVSGEHLSSRLFSHVFDSDTGATAVGEARNIMQQVDGNE